MPLSTTTSSSTPSGSGRLVTGLFPDRASAESAYGSAHDRGYSADDVNLVMSDDTRKRHFTGTRLARKPNSATRLPKVPVSAARSVAAWVRLPRRLPLSARAWCSQVLGW